MVVLRHYVSREGKNIFEDWLASLKDEKAEARINARLNRLIGGNFGDCKPVGRGVWELRIDLGPGYRVYYSMVSRTIALLLGGGDKRKQAADIATASARLKDYKDRSAKL